MLAEAAGRAIIYLGSYFMPAVQAEAWFKVELISLLYQLQRAGTIASFDRECLTGNGRKKMDFKIEFANLIGAIEVKTALCAQQKKFNYDLMWYAKDTRRDSSFLSDIFKLTSIAGFNPVTPLSFGIRLSSSQHRRVEQHTDRDTQQSSGPDDQLSERTQFLLCQLVYS